MLSVFTRREVGSMPMPSTHTRRKLQGGAADSYSARQGSIPWRLTKSSSIRVRSMGRTRHSDRRYAGSTPAPGTAASFEAATLSDNQCVKKRRHAAARSFLISTMVVRRPVKPKDPGSSPGLGAGSVDPFV